MVAGRVLAEALIGCVATVIFVVILGLKDIDGAMSASPSTGGGLSNALTSTDFFVVLLIMIYAGIALVEIAYHRRESRQRQS